MSGEARVAATELGALRAAVAILAGATATIAGAWTFEVLGYAPCELCLAQRWPYYLGIPLAGVTVLLALQGPARFVPAAFVGLTLLFGASAIFGAYHAGVEWGFWPGPSACTGTLSRADSVADFLAQLDTVQVVRCDAPALRILGLSLAGWNALISAGLSGLAARGAAIAR